MSSKKRILLVDDDPNSSYILSMILKLNGFDVIPYTDPEQALTDFGKDLYDLLLLEVRMSKMNGFELYQKMKQIDRHIKVCFMTNYRRQYLREFNELFPRLTADSLVDKPASGNDLMKILQRHLNNL
jgi:CheY-like chemotaxis protein